MKSNSRSSQTMFPSLPVALEGSCKLAAISSKRPDAPRVFLVSSTVWTTQAGERARKTRLNVCERHVEQHFHRSTVPLPRLATATYTRVVASAFENTYVAEWHRGSPPRYTYTTHHQPVYLSAGAKPKAHSCNSRARLKKQWLSCR